MVVFWIKMKRSSVKFSETHTKESVQAVYCLPNAIIRDSNGIVSWDTNSVTKKQQTVHSTHDTNPSCINSAYSAYKTWHTPVPHKPHLRSNLKNIKFKIWVSLKKDQEPLERQPTHSFFFSSIRYWPCFNSNSRANNKWVAGELAFLCDYLTDSLRLLMMLAQYHLLRLATMSVWCWVLLPFGFPSTLLILIIPWTWLARRYMGNKRKYLSARYCLIKFSSFSESSAQFVNCDVWLFLRFVADKEIRQQLKKQK